MPRSPRKRTALFGVFGERRDIAVAASVAAGTDAGAARPARPVAAAGIGARALAEERGSEDHGGVDAVAPGSRGGCAGAVGLVEAPVPVEVLVVADACRHVLARAPLVRVELGERRRRGGRGGFLVAVLFGGGWGETKDVRLRETKDLRVGESGAGAEVPKGGGQGHEKD